MPEDTTTHEDLTFEEICELAQRDRLTLSMTLSVVYGFDYEYALSVSDAAALSGGNIEWFRGLVGSMGFHVHRPVQD